MVAPSKCETTAAVPKGWRPRLSLKFALILLTAVGITLALYSHEARQQARLFNVVRALEGGVIYEYEFNGDVVDTKAIPPGPKWLIDILGIDYFTRVRTIDLNQKTGIDLASFPVSPQVRALWLLESDVDSLENIGAKFPNLKNLWIAGTKVQDITPVADLQSLEWLGMKDTPVLDVSPLFGLNRLETLFVDGEFVGADEISRLRKRLPNCEIIPD